MIEVDVPGGETLQLAHLVLDYNGTLARDGNLLDGVGPKIEELAPLVQVHVLTADTHGTVREKLSGLSCSLHIIGPGGQDRQKEAYVRSLGSKKVTAIGNGKNDSLMLKSAALGFVLVQEEGASTAALIHADILCNTILDAFDILLKPERLKATLRN
ncbi:MAG: hypothetical protein WBB19_15420 [Desulforhopalus sp.]